MASSRGAKSTTRQRVGVSASRKVSAPWPGATGRSGNRRNACSPPAQRDRPRVPGADRDGENQIPRGGRPAPAAGEWVEIVILLAVPADRGLADGAQRPAIVVAEIIEARIVRAGVSWRRCGPDVPAAGALGRLFRHLNSTAIPDRRTKPAAGFLRPRVTRPGLSCRRQENWPSCQSFVPTAVAT